jgi:transcriptional regulator with XRE-family HTH domain
MMTETLSEYVARIIKQKGLTHAQVVKNSGNRIARGYISGIITGTAVNLSIEKLHALADGLGVPVGELLAVAYRVDTSSKPDALVILDLMEKVVLSPLLLEILSEVVRLSEPAQKVILNNARTLANAKKKTKVSSS